MQHRTRSQAFIRNLVDAATVRPLWTALLVMKQARALSTRPTSPSTLPAFEAPAPITPQKAA